MPAARQCPSCGASVELPPERLADSCAFCEAPLVDASGEAEPVEHVLPFDVDRERAARALRGWLQGKWLAPEAVRKAARPAALHGVLVPFWVFDGVARSRWDARVGVNWSRTTTSTHVVNGRPQVRTRTVTETEWFPLSGTHAATYTRQLVSASRGLPEAEANGLEPFDLGRATPWSPERVAGWIAERPTVDHDEAARIVAREVAERENATLRREFLPGDRAEDVRNDTSLAIERVELALLPVWIATFRRGGKPFRLLVNGQTAEVVGVAPRSPWKVGCLVALLLGAVAAIAAAGTLVALVVGWR